LQRCPFRYFREETKYDTRRKQDHAMMKHRHLIVGGGMTLSEAAARVALNTARVGLIATVSIIIVINTLSPLLKEPARSSDTRALAAFAVPLSLPERNAGLPAIDQAGDRTSQISSPPKNNLGATDASARVMPASDLLSASSPPSSLISEQRPTEGSAPAATLLNAESSQPGLVAVVKQPPRAEQRTKRRYSKDMVRSRPAPSSNSSSSFSYNEQLAPRSN
jgi:hypothetical protein